MILSVILQGLGAIIAFGTTVFIFRSLTKDEAGIFSLVSSYLIVTISFIDFGIIAAVYPKISLSNGINSPVFKAGFILRSVTLLLGFLGLNLFLFLTNKSTLLLYVNLFFGVALFSNKASGVRQFFEAVLRLKGRTYLVSTISLLDGIIGIISIFILKFYHTLTLFNVFLVLSSSSLIGFVIISFPIIKFLISEKIFKYNIRISYYKSLILTALPIALMSVIGQLFSQVETFIISSNLSNSDIAGYNAAFRPFQGIVFVPVMLSIGIAPIVTQIFKLQRNDVRMESILEFGLKVFLLISLSIFIIINVFSENIITLFGSQYSSETNLLKIYSITSGLSFIIIFFDQMLLAIGFRIKVFYGSLLGLSIAVCLQLSLINVFGVIGIMYVKIFSTFCVILFQLYSMTSEMRKGVFNGLLKFTPVLFLIPISMYLSIDSSIILRISIPIIILIISFFLLRIFTIKELNIIRSLKL